jgi:hypothetical protein
MFCSNNWCIIVWQTLAHHLLVDQILYAILAMPQPIVRVKMVTSVNPHTAKLSAQLMQTAQATCHARTTSAKAPALSTAVRIQPALLSVIDQCVNVNVVTQGIL